MESSDALYILFLVICCWLAMNWDSNGGGGKRCRVPVKS